MSVETPRKSPESEQHVVIELAPVEQDETLEEFLEEEAILERWAGEGGYYSD